MLIREVIDPHSGASTYVTSEAEADWWTKGRWAGSGGGGGGGSGGTVSASTLPSVDYAGGAAAAADATKYLQEAKDAYNASITNANAGLSAIQAGGATVQADLDKARSSAAGITDQVAGVNKAADQIATESDAFRQYAYLLGLYGGEMYGQGKSVADQGQGILGIGNSLLNLDGSTALGSEFLRIYNALRGDNAASRAAADVQSSYANAYGQLVRDIARRGGSGTSGNALALKQQLQQSLATALAAAKTRARQQGLVDQASMLDKITSAGNSILSSGATVFNSGVQAEAAGASATKSASDVQSELVSALAKSGELRASGGNLLAQQASAYTSAAGVDANYLNTLRSAYGDVTQANTEYGKFLGDIAGGFAAYAVQNNAASRIKA